MRMRTISPARDQVFTWILYFFVGGQIFSKHAHFFPDRGEYAHAYRYLPGGQMCACTVLPCCLEHAHGHLTRMLTDLQCTNATARFVLEMFSPLFARDLDE